MIKKSLLLYAPPGTGKTTYLQRTWRKDRHQDLAINLNRSYGPIKHEQQGYHTREYLVTPERKTPALSLSAQPDQWVYQIADYQKHRPVIKHLLIDEVQCAIPVYLTQIIQLVRGFYHTTVPVIMCGLMSGTFHGKRRRLPQMKGLSKITEKVVRFHRPDN